MKKINKKYIHIALQVLFWLSNLALFSYTLFLAIMAVSETFVMGNTGLTSQTFPLFYPAIVVFVSSISAFFLARKKRILDMFTLFFAVQLPLMLIAFARIFFYVYPNTILLLALIILASTALIWYSLLWGERKNEFNSALKKYIHVPFILGTVLSGWLFLIWFFWVPYVLYTFFSEFRFEGFFSWLFSGYIFHAWWILPAFITGFYFFLSPLLAFGMFVWNCVNLKFSKKLPTILAATVLIVGGTFFVDVLEKSGPIADIEEAKRKIELSLEDKDEFFPPALIKEISNRNRLKESAKKIFLAQYKFPFQDSAYGNPIRDTVNRSYCKTWYYEDDEATSCTKVSKVYEKLFFPLYYHGNMSEDIFAANTIYAHVFDASLQEELAADIVRFQKRSVFGGQLWTRGRSNAEASVLKKYERLIHLDEATHDVNINTDAGVYTNTITYTFRNTTEGQQEAYMEITLPDEHAVITDLRLGLGLQFESQVAPRGAAKSVYEESLRRRIDPALLEKIGPRQYQLRVFPIQPKSHSSGGMQRVQVEYTAFIPRDGVIKNASLFSRNLDIDGQTNITVNASNKNGGAFAQTKKISNRGLTEAAEIINLEQYELGHRGTIFAGSDGYVTHNLMDAPKESGNVTFYLDNSASANKTSVRRVYKELRKKYPSARFFTYSFEVNDLEKDEEIEFIGPTKTSELVSFISQNIENGENIKIITDDSNYEIDSTELIDIDYSQIQNAKKIDIYVVGERLPIFKKEITNAFYATPHSGDVKVISGAVDIEKSDDYAVRWGRSGDVGWALIEEPKWREAVEDLWASYKGRLKIANIVDEESWYEAANQQTEIASRAHIVNQFASLIALENDWQQDQLDAAKKRRDKYRSDHDIGETDDVVVISDQSGDEPRMLVLLVVALLVGLSLTAKNVFVRKSIRKVL